MNATMTIMEWRVVDNILVDTLEVGDNILIDGNIVEIVDLYEETEALIITYLDEYGDLVEDTALNYDDKIDIYMLFDGD